MGSIIKNGFDFVARANGHLLRGLTDDPALKHQLISLSETKSHRDLSVYALTLAAHLIELGELERADAIEQCFAAVTQWQQQGGSFRPALDIAGELNDLARAEKDPIKAKALRGLGQVAATPHVRWHPLVASEYAIAVVNLRHPHDLEQAAQERRFQIDRMTESIYRP